MSEVSTEQIEALHQKLQDIEFLLLFVQTDVVLLNSRVNAVLANQGADNEELKASFGPAWKQAFDETFAQWPKNRAMIQAIIAKHRKDAPGDA